jgi:hypothetical protein
MTKDLEKEIQATKEQLERLQKQLKNKQPWFPEECEEFYFINELGGVCETYQTKVYYYGDAAEYKEYFRTYEQAERVAKARKAIRELAFKPHEIDWNDEMQRRWVLMYDHYEHEFDIALNLLKQCLGEVYFPTKEAAKQAEPHFRVLIDEGVGM